MVIFASIVVSMEIIGGITFGATLISGRANVLMDHNANMWASYIWDMDDLHQTFEDHYTTSKYQTQHLNRQTNIPQKYEDAPAQKLISLTLPMSSDYASSKDRTNIIRLLFYIIGKTVVYLYTHVVCSRLKFFLEWLEV
jgi:hypothetical protein